MGAHLKVPSFSEFSKNFGGAQFLGGYKSITYGNSNQIVLNFYFLAIVVLIKHFDSFFPKGYISTIGIEYKVKKIKYDGIDINLQIWDICGQESFMGITKSFLKETNNII